MDYEMGSYCSSEEDDDVCHEKKGKQCDSINFGGSFAMIGGHGNRKYGTGTKPKPSNKEETKTTDHQVRQSKPRKPQMGRYPPHPIAPYGGPPPSPVYGYPPPYGGPPPHPQMAAAGCYGYYGGYNHGQGYQQYGQFPSPYQGGYNYGMSSNYGGAPMNMGLPDGGRAANGAPVYGHGQHENHNHDRPHMMSKGSGGAAADGDGQHDTVKHAHHDHSHGGGHMAVGGAAAAGAAAAYGHQGQLAHERSYGGGHAAGGAAVAYGHAKHDTVKHAPEHNHGGGHMAVGGAAAAAAAAAVY